MSKSPNQDLTPAGEVKARVSNRIKLSRHFGAGMHIVGTLAGAISAEAVYQNGSSPTGVFVTALGALGLGFLERKVMYRDTNKFVTDFEQAQYDALPTEKTSPVVSIFTRDVIVEAGEVKPIDEPDPTPPAVHTTGESYLSRFAPMASYMGAFTAVDAIRETSHNMVARVAEGGFSVGMISLAAVCEAYSGNSEADQRAACYARIDTAANPGV